MRREHDRQEEAGQGGHKGAMDEEPPRPRQAQDLIEASLRFAMSNTAVSTVLSGYSSLEHLEHAVASVAKGPLAAAALERLSTLWQQLASGPQAR